LTILSKANFKRMGSEKKLGSYLQNLRKERKLSLREVANYIGIDISMLSKIEHGERQIQAYQLSSIAEFFKIEFRQLQIEFLMERIHLNYGDQPFLKESLEKYLNEKKFKNEKTIV
jgi:transcriptional regulator with XRE-family HTH domain